MMLLARGPGRPGPLAVRYTPIYCLLNCPRTQSEKTTVAHSRQHDKAPTSTYELFETLVIAKDRRDEGHR